MSAHLVLIDALNLIRRIYAVQERPFLFNNELAENTKQQVLFNTQIACGQALTKILDHLQPSHVLAVFDSDKPCWRYELFPDYKKGRKKRDKDSDKFLKKVDKAAPDRDARSRARIKGNTIYSVVQSRNRSSVNDDQKQVDHNEKDKESRATAKRMMNRAGLESAYKKSGNKPTSKTEAMNFTDWTDSLCDPLYEINGLPECPPGYKWDKKTMACVPKSDKDNVGKNNSKDRHPENGPGFNTIGSHGQNGAPYAYEEPATGSSDGGGY